MSKEDSSAEGKAFPAGSLHRLHKLVSGLMDRAVAPAGITYVQWQSLQVADRAPPMRLVDIAKILAITPGVMTRLADVLQARGLVERARCPLDRRSVCISLTVDGRAALKRAAPLVAAQCIELAAALDPGDAMQLGRLLDRAAAAIARLDPPGR